MRRIELDLISVFYKSLHYSSSLDLFLVIEKRISDMSVCLSTWFSRTSRKGGGGACLVCGRVDFGTQSRRVITGLAFIIDSDGVRST